MSDHLIAEANRHAKALTHHAERKDAIARAERAEAIVEKLQELHGCSQEMVVHWCEHAANRSLGLDQARSELATERERVRVLREALDEAQSCGGLTGSIFMQARAALAATEGKP